MLITSVRSMRQTMRCNPTQKMFFHVTAYVIKAAFMYFWALLGSKHELQAPDLHKNHFQTSLFQLIND